MATRLVFRQPTAVFAKLPSLWRFLRWRSAPVGRYSHQQPPRRQIFAVRFRQGIIGLGEVERQIPFIHAGRKRKFPVNSLFLRQDLCILGRIRRFLGRIRKIPC